MINRSSIAAASKALILCLGVVMSVTGLGQEKKPGDVLWSFPVFSINPSSPAIDNNAIYFTEGRDLISINPDGSFKWEKPNIDIDSYTAAPAITIEDNIFVRLRSKRQGIYSFNPSGIIEWYMINNYKYKSNPAMSYNGDIYIIGQKQGMNLDRENGLVSIGLNKEVKWEFHKSNITISGNPAVGLDDVIYVFGRDVIQGINRLYAINQEGKEIWSYETEDIKSTSFAIDKNSTIYFGAKNKLYAINKAGEKKWIFHNSKRITSSPAIGLDGAIYFGSDSELVSINANGTKRWAYKSYGIIESSPAIDNGNIIYFGTKKKVFAINEAGKKEWEVELAADIFWPDGIKTSPAIDNDGTLFIGANKLYAIKTSSSGPANSAWPMLGQNSRRTYSISTPVIIEGPKNLIVLKEQKANFEVKPKGTEPLSYQWYKNDIAIDGETNFRLQLDNVQEADEGRYSVKVQNIFGESLSEKANLIVPESDTIILIDDEYVKEESSGVDKVKIEIKSNIQENEIFYTLDGSKPSFTSTPYSAPFQLTESATIRVIAYSSDFTESAEAEPVSFRILTTYSLNVSGTGGGTVTIDPPNGPYLEGTEVTLTASPESEWEFIGWEGDSTSSDATITITMDGAKSLNPIFGTNVKVNAIGGGNVIQNPPNPVPYGSTVSIEAVPDDGNYFFRWAGETKEEKNPAEFHVKKPNPIVSALFAQGPEFKEGDLVWEKYFQFDGLPNNPNAIRSSPVLINDNNVIFLGPARLYSINGGNGELAKKISIPGFGGAGHFPDLIMDGKYIYFPLQGWSIAKNITEGWAKSVKHYVSNLTTSRDNIFYTTGWGDNKLYALDKKDGNSKWSKTLVKANKPSVGWNDTLYVGSKNTFQALNATTGEQKWVIEDNFTFSSAAIDSDGTLYMASDSDVENVYSKGNMMYAINALNGNIRWKKPIQGYLPQMSSPVIGLNKLVIIGTIYYENNAAQDYRSIVQAFNGLTGELEWTYKSDNRMWCYHAPVVSNNNTIYILLDSEAPSNVVALDANSSGKEKWVLKTDRAAKWISPPQILNNGNLILHQMLFRSVIDDSNIEKKAIKLFSIKGDVGPALSPWPMFGQNAQRTGRAPSPVPDPIQITIPDKTAWPFTVSFTTAEGSTYVFQASGDLKNWSKVEEVNGTGGEVKVTDLREAIFQKQYYRVKLVE